MNVMKMSKKPPISLSGLIFININRTRKTDSVPVSYSLKNI